MTREEICRAIRAKAVRMSGDPDLEAWCAICSTAIAMAFIAHGYEGRVRIGMFWGADDHCWVWSNDWNHYDITATQFSQRKSYAEIEIVPEPDPCQEDGTEQYPRPWVEFDPVYDDFDEHFAGWPEEQIPDRRRIRELLAAADTSHEYADTLAER
jgi:hypothetical protein